MTVIRAIDIELTLTAIKWRAAVLAENREAETVCMAHINHLLDQRTLAAGPPKPDAQ